MAPRSSVQAVPLSKVASELAEKTGMTKKDAASTLDELADVVTKHLKKGDKVRIRGLEVVEAGHHAVRAGASDRVHQRIVERAEKLIGSRESAEAWFRYQPLPAFQNKTPRQLVDEGRSDAVLLHLDTLEDGAYA